MKGGLRTFAGIVTISVLMLVFSVLPAFGKQKVKLIYPVQVAGRLAKAMEDLVSDFNATNPNVEVVPIFAGGYTAAMQRIQASVSAGTPPDLAILNAPSTLTLLDMNAIESLDKFIEKEGGQKYIDEFFAQFFENARVEGKIWAMPWQHSTPLFYYNKDMLRAAGLKPDAPPQTWEELAKAAKKLKIVEAGKVKRWGFEFPVHEWTFQAMVMQQGKQLGYRDKVYLNTPAAVRALRFLNDLVKDKAMPKQRKYGDSSEDFVAQKAAMMYNSTGGLGFVRDRATFDWGAAFLPKPKDGQYAVPYGGATFYMFKKIPESQKSAAWEFIKWMTSVENTARWSRASGYVPIKKAAVELPAMQEYFEKIPQARVAIDQLQYAGPKIMVHAQLRIKKIIITALQQTFQGIKTPEQALSDAQSEAEKVLEAFKK